MGGEATGVTAPDIGGVAVGVTPGGAEVGVFITIGVGVAGSPP